MTIWHELGTQLRHPRGFMGRAIGVAMRAVNRIPNKRAVGALRIRPADKLLELGFGPGQAVAMMARQAGAEGVVYGVDASPVMLAQAQRQNRHTIAQGRVVLCLGDFSPLDFPDAFF